MYRTATFSGRVEISGKVLRMSVKTLESGCAFADCAGFRREDTEG